MFKSTSLRATIYIFAVVLFSGCGPKVTMVVGFDKGGGFDIYSRAIASHMSKHLPGNLPITVENMPGYGSLAAATYLYGQRKSDPPIVGSFNGRLILAQLLGTLPGIQFDALKFAYVGVPLVDTPVCALTKSSGITTVERWMAAKSPVRLGGSFPGAIPYDLPKILQVSLNLPIQLTSGYTRIAELIIDAELGKIAGFCDRWEIIKLAWREAIEAGHVIIILQATSTAHPELPNVPLAMNLAKTVEARSLIQAGIHSAHALSWLFVLPPSTPKENLQMMRQAFMDTMKDEEFLATARNARLTINSLPGEEVERIVDGLFKLNPAILEKLKEILTPALGYVDQGITYARKGLYDEAIAEFDRALAIDPSYADAYYNKAIVYSRKGLRDEAITIYSKALEFNPKDVRAFLNRGNAYADKGLYAQAIADYTAALRIDSTYVDGFFARGTAYLKKKLYNEAIVDFNRALEIDRTHVGAYVNRGFAYGAKGLADKAIADFDRALEIDPRLPLAHYLKATILEETHRKKEALSAYKSFLQYAHPQQDTDRITHAKHRISELEK